MSGFICDSGQSISEECISCTVHLQLAFLLTSFKREYFQETNEQDKRKRAKKINKLHNMNQP